MTFRLSDRSLHRMVGVDRRLIEIARLAITLTPVDFGIPGDGGLRSAERQHELFDQGVSKCDGVDKKSYHQTGKALDFFAYVGGAANWDPKYLSMVACAFMQAAIILGYKIKWGGLWKGFRDMPHIQLIGD